LAGENTRTLKQTLTLIRSVKKFKIRNFKPQRQKNGATSTNLEERLKKALREQNLPNEAASPSSVPMDDIPSGKIPRATRPLKMMSQTK
jgi:hypothetical protein